MRTPKERILYWRIGIMSYFSAAAAAAVDRDRRLYDDEDSNTKPSWCGRKPEKPRCGVIDMDYRHAAAMH